MQLDLKLKYNLYKRNVRWRYLCSITNDFYIKEELMHKINSYTLVSFGFDFRLPNLAKESALATSLKPLRPCNRSKTGGKFALAEETLLLSDVFWNEKQMSIFHLRSFHLSQWVLGFYYRGEMGCWLDAWALQY